MTTAVQRRYERVPFFCDLEVVDPSTGISQPGRGIDLSRGGIGFWSAHFVPVGKHIRLVISLPNGGRLATARLAGVVVRARAENDGAIMGLSFDEPLAPLSQPMLCGFLDRK